MYLGFKHSEKSKKMMSVSKLKLRPIEKRFWKLVRKQSGCWKWLGKTDEDGYGKIWFRGRNMGAHRVSWILHKGEIPTGKHVLHECDNPSCTNPKHLFLGTSRDNIDDMLAKGRSLKGERHNNHKLTESQVIEALKWRPRQGEKLGQMATRMGVSQVALELIRSGTNWKHLYHLHSRFEVGNG